MFEGMFSDVAAQFQAKILDIFLIDPQKYKLWYSLEEHL